MKYLVLDIGGSAIKYALMTKELKFIEKGNTPTPMEGIESFVETVGKKKNVEKYHKTFENINGSNFYVPKPNVVRCEFRNDANLIGALYNFFTFQS